MREGLLQERETSAWVEYITRVEALNRALDQAGQASAVNQTQQMLSQINQARRSAGEILNPSPSSADGQSIFEVVERTIQRPRKRRNIPFRDSFACGRKALRKLCECGQSSG